MSGSSQLQLVVWSFAVAFSLVSVIFLVHSTGPANTNVSGCQQRCGPLMLIRKRERWTGVRLAHLNVAHHLLSLCILIVSSFVRWAGEVACRPSSSCPWGWWSGVATLSHLSSSSSAHWAGKVACNPSLCPFWWGGVVIHLLGWQRGIVHRPLGW
jgi:hypothetical protein